MENWIAIGFVIFDCYAFSWYGWANLLFKVRYFPQFCIVCELVLHPAQGGVGRSLLTSMESEHCCGCLLLYSHNTCQSDFWSSYHKDGRIINWEANRGSYEWINVDFLPAEIKIKCKHLLELYKLCVVWPFWVATEDKPHQTTQPINNWLVQNVCSISAEDAYVVLRIGVHWFNQWLVACSLLSHYLNQCLCIVNLDNMEYVSLEFYSK